MKARIRSLKQLARTEHWWAQKASPMLAVAYLEIFLHHAPPAAAFPYLAGLLFFIICLGAFGNFINDIFDIDLDRRAGKWNAMAQCSPWQRLAFCLVTAAVGGMPWGFLPLTLTAKLLLVVFYLAQPLYAIPPVRLKERGFWAVITDSVYTRVVPVWFVAETAGRLVPWRHPADLPLTVAVTALAFFNGLREIIHHQIQDAPGDRRGGATTFVTCHGEDSARRLVKRYIFPAELVCVSATLAVIFTFAPGIACFFFLFAGILGLSWLLGVWNISFRDPVPFLWDEYVPLREGYKVWPALAFAAELALQRPLYLSLLVVHVVLFYRKTREEACDALDIFGWSAEDLASRLAAGNADPEMKEERDAGNVAFVLPDGMSLGGVTSWSIAMADALSTIGCRTHLVEHVNERVSPQYEVPSGVSVLQQRGVHPHHATNVEVAGYERLYRKLLPGVLIPNYYCGTYAASALLARRHATRMRVIAFAHTDEEDYYRLLSYYEPLIHLFVAVSGQVAGKLAERIPTRRSDIVTRPYGVKTSAGFRRDYSKGDAPLRIVYSGRLVEKQKRVSDLARVATSLSVRRVDFRLDIVGEGRDEDALLRAIQALEPEVRGRIAFRGMVSPARMLEIWREADVCLLVSEYEGFSISMIEAMAAGCVPVVTKVSGAEGFIRSGENGYLAEVGDVEGLAEAIAKLAADRDALERMGGKAHESVDVEFSLERYTQWFSEVVERVWSEPDRPWPRRKALMPPYHRPRASILRFRIGNIWRRVKKLLAVSGREAGVADAR